MTVRMKKNAKVTEDIFSGDIVRHVVHKNMVRSILFLLCLIHRRRRKFPDFQGRVVQMVDFNLTYQYGCIYL